MLVSEVDRNTRHRENNRSFEWCRGICTEHITTFDLGSIPSVFQCEPNPRKDGHDDEEDQKGFHD